MTIWICITFYTVSDVRYSNDSNKAKTFNGDFVLRYCVDQLRT